MPLRIALRPAAEADLDAIWTGTTETWSEAQAVIYLRGLESMLRLLAEFPEMARPRTEFVPPVRVHPYRSHLIIYSADADMLDVLRVVHARTNWSSFLAE